MMATMFSVFSLPVVADSVEKFSAADHSVPVDYVGQQTVAIAECDRCMYAGLGDKQPLIVAEVNPSIAWPDGSGINASLPYEVGWRN